ncbi:alpha-1,2-fucosyltransferase [Paenibacillus roseipurpureus]|uniref:Alpha-1,2-fucosyltransferase n=1 Tax=Paenibacillus roseopurpureus TaxID=2918901 RepID=A0AA96LPC0_9BACL|nr:alpha-1,2-fucosyltransferase [Paenibacillus sp. MBLB1832]WNR43509.1 alpha-1,2-fucosyltransferase [Paenibacillus sp. MBLB1832]
MIVIKLQGGLGNQMFQYAFGRAIQNKLGGELILDTSDYKFDKLRKLSLDNFVLNEELKYNNRGSFNILYDQRTNYLIKIFVKFAPNILFSVLSTFGIYIWDDAVFKDFTVSSSNKNIYLHGYWQSERYFKEISSMILKELQVKTSVKVDNLDIYNLIASTESVCVHIRRGDFLSNSNSLKVCEQEYFLKGMDLIASRVENPVFIIFSDDISDVKRNFDFKGYNINFVEKNNQDYEELQLMYSCKHFIISNSTFSWWAQYLSQNRNKIVIAPKVWYTDGKNSDGLMMDKWIVIS